MGCDTTPVAAPVVGRPTRSAQRGFTLIELIAIVVLVAILATAALPRYMGLTEEAHRSVVAQTSATFDTAVSLASAACNLRDFASRDNLSAFGAGNVDFNANCYPSSTNGNNNLNVNAARCMQIWNGLLANAPSISTPANDNTEYRAQGSGTTCAYTYREDDTLRRFTYNAANGSIAVINP